MTDKEVMQMALEALEESTTYTSSPSWSPSMTEDCNKAITALRARLEQSDAGIPVSEKQAEPVTHMHEWFSTGAMGPGKMRCIHCGAWGNDASLTTPPAAQRKPLTHEQIWEIHDRCIPPTEGYVSPVDFARAIEAAHGIGETT